jgi:hypothetical protein
MAKIKMAIRRNDDAFLEIPGIIVKSKKQKNLQYYYLLEMANFGIDVDSSLMQIDLANRSQYGWIKAGGRKWGR